MPLSLRDLVFRLCWRL
ncbi:unnamed protein product [Victoria cruziana]